MTRLFRCSVPTFVLGLALAFAPAGAVRAEIFAATCVEGPSGNDQDIAILSASLGTRVVLPAAVNTRDTERFPTISSDGRRLAFERRRFDGSQRLIVADLATGQIGDLFTAAEIAQDRIYRSAITPDGATVATGRDFRFLFFDFRYHPRATLTSLASFPNGPFSRSTLTAMGTSSGQQQLVTGVAAGGSNLFALEFGGIGQVALAQSGGNSSAALQFFRSRFSQPALAATNPTLVFFVEKQSPLFGEGNIVFRPATIAGFVGTPTRIEFGVSTELDESMPAVTADERYLAFIREVGGMNDRLFVWNRQTQTFLNPDGVDSGGRELRDSCGSMSLYTRNVIASSLISRSGSVTATLTTASNIGILVQRIVGKTEVLGKKAWELEPVGRVPLGSFGAGNVFTHWDFEVDGEPLPPGKYQVTLRAVEDTTEGTVVRELGEPQVIRIKKGKKEH